MFTASTVRILSTIYHFRFRFLFKDSFASFCFAFACRIRFVPEPGQYSELHPDSESDASHFGANVVVDTTSLDSNSSQIRFEKGLDFGTGRECGRSKRKRTRKGETRRTRTKSRSSKGTRTRVWERKRKRESEKERKRKGRVKGTGRRRGRGREKIKGTGRGRERGRFEFRRHRTPASAGSPVPEASARRRAGHGAPAYKQGCPPINLVIKCALISLPGSSNLIQAEKYELICEFQNQLFGLFFHCFVQGLPSCE